MNPPNIVFIVLDALRADKIPSQYENKTLTPFINELLNQSILFKNCIANSIMTPQSHISMFTGLYPTQNFLISKSPHELSTKVPVLTEILKEMGYMTICYSENPHISRPDFNRGFDKVINNWKNSLNLWKPGFTFLNFLDLIVKNRIKSNFFLKIWDLIIHLIRSTINKIVEILLWKTVFIKNKSYINELDKIRQVLQNKVDNKPIYMFFNIMATHNPYIPDKKSLNYFKITNNEIKSIKNFLLDSGKFFLDTNYNLKIVDKKKKELINKFYNACVFYCDLYIKKIFSILKMFNLIENSYIILTSDHGEHLCDQTDHYFWGHCVWHSVYESQIKVPLIIYNNKFKKQIVENQVQLKDLFQTILHLTRNFPRDNEIFNLNKSIIYQIDNNCTPKYIFGEFLKTKERILNFINSNIRHVKKSLYAKLFSKMYFLRSDTFKYIKYDKGIEEFYDLKNDPHELLNIINKGNNEYKKMKLITNEIIQQNNNKKVLEKILTNKEKWILENSIKKIKIF